MKIIELKNIVRKDVPIYYRLLYSGVAVIELFKIEEYNLDFTVEIKPTGLAEISINSLDDIHYPLLPIVKELKRIINTLHNDDKLPE